MHELADSPMVGMVVAGAVCQDQVGREAADLADHPLADLERGHQLAVGDVPGFVGRTDDASRGGGLLAAHGTKHCRRPLEMPRGAVGQGDNLHHTTQVAVGLRQPAGMVFGIVGVRAENQQA